MAAERILIVDDDMDSLKLVGLMLQKQGYEIIAANNGASGIEKATSGQPDLIILDIMMPDISGYEVARRLRSNPETAAIPILMFTAKTMVDDKVAGFEAGADDYITKPTHPAELVSRIKAALLRAASRPAAAPEPHRYGQIISFIGAKGGVGTTTLAINCAILFSRMVKELTVVLAEIRPGQGSLGWYLDYSQADALPNLVSKGMSGITPRAVEAVLVTHRSGIRAFLSSFRPTPHDDRLTPELAEHLVRNLAATGDLLILDLGNGLNERSQRLVNMSNQIVIAVEPGRIALSMAREMLDSLRKIDIGPTRLGFILINRVASGMATSWRDAQEQLGIDLLGIIPPAPELAYQATEAAAPMIMLQSEAAGVFQRQMSDLMGRLITRLGLEEEAS
jgi:CheY-like chemotaxis protein/MinD-like ATPase involved in chromosome partitioning or flagellar assembly